MAPRPANPSPLATAVLAAVASAADTTPEELPPEMELLELGLDSLDFWEILMQVEDATDADVPTDVLNALTQLDEGASVGELVAILSAWSPAAGGLPAGRAEPAIVIQQP